MDVSLPALAIVLIVIQIADGIACIQPIAPIRKSLDRINCPATVRRLLPFLKLDSAAGLIMGLWVPVIGLLTIAALVVYFIVAIEFHRRAGDTATNTAPAVAMLIFVIAVGALSYLPAI